VFAVPWTRIDWHGGPRILRDHGFGVVALTPHPQATPLPDVDVASYARIALALGSEDDGLSGHYLKEADVLVRIPMRQGIDSLNVAAAAAVALYALRPPD
jgi:tRNA G18 (ribose-2'-O)-methylase SpoU